MKLPSMVYDEVVERAKVMLFVVLGVVYLLAVILLEVFIMPSYVYQPLRLMLGADRATQAGDRSGELIPEALIPGDEIGQIMRSRNATVAELRRQEDELQRKNEQLETAKKNLADQDRLVSLGLLSASVAHEMNTPLAVLRGSIEKLTETTGDPHARERLARMQRVTERLRKISESLLDFARVRRPEMKRVALRPLVEEAWNLVAFDEKAAEVRFTNSVDGEHAVTGDADRLMQVFVNLLRNALHAIHANGCIEVCSRECVKEGEKWIAITVNDDGPGIPADVLPDIFDAFVSTRLDSNGTGLGLTVAEGIVTQHRGSISASNRPEGERGLKCGFGRRFR